MFWVQIEKEERRGKLDLEDSKWFKEQRLLAVVVV